MIQIKLSTSFKSKIEITAREMERQQLSEMPIKGGHGQVLVRADSNSNTSKKVLITKISVDGKDYLVCMA